MTGPEPFELNAFNTLPRPIIRAALDAGTPQSLGEIFPYLFKPNRAIAWARSWDLRFPLRERDLRWLIRIPLGERSGAEPVFAALGARGALSLWIYRLVDDDPEKGPALQRLSLVAEGGNEEAPELRLVLTRGSGEISSPARYFYLERFLNSCDREGGVRLRLFTPIGEHRIDLDFSRPAERPVRYSHRFFKASTGDRKPIHQVAGWNGDVPVYWAPAGGDSVGHLIVGRSDSGQGCRLDGLRAGVPVRAAAYHDGAIVAGGDDECLWIGDASHPSLQADRRDPDLRGYIRSLAILSVYEGRPSIILAGCDEHFLHIFDRRAHRLQKVNMGGTVEAILPLDSVPAGDWFDLAVIVRDRGLMCVRLFADRFEFEGGDKRDRDEKTELIERLVAVADAFPHQLGTWLGSRHFSEQLLGFALLLHRPGLFLHRLELLDSLPLEILDLEVVRFVVHTIKRRIDQGAPGIDDDRILAHYLRLLHRFAVGAYRTRQSVMHLQGWLLGLRRRVVEGSEAARMLRALIDVYCDAKRLLRRNAVAADSYLLATESRARSNLDECLGLVAALEERLRFKRLFNEIVLTPEGPRSRVDATAIALGRDGFGLQLFGRRGDRRLRSFRTRYSTLSIHPEGMGRDWPVLPGEPSSHIRVLVPLGSDGLLVITEDAAAIFDPWSASMADQGDRSVQRLKQPGDGLELHSCAGCDDGDGYLVAVGVSGSDRGGAPVALLRIGADREAADWQWLPTQEIPGRVRVNALAWESHDWLWGATDGPGYLLCWQRSSAGNWRVESLLAVGSAQYAIRVLKSPASEETLVVMAGEDGVVRTFDTTGRMKWARVLQGAVRGLSTGADAEARGYAPIAAITERETLALYSASGDHMGLLELPGEHLTALYSGPVSPEGVQHHLIGTLWGEVRLVEEVSDAYANDPLEYLAVQKSSQPDTDDRVDWPKVRTAVRNQLEEWAKDHDRCARWTKHNSADREPLRACWAARQLLGRHSDFDSVLTLLEGFSDRDDAHAREMRAHVFGAIGANLPNMPIEVHGRLIELCEKARDGALASLLTHSSPDQVRCDHELQRAVLGVVWDKVLDGLPFVSSALLQRLQTLPESSGNPLEWLARMLAKTAEGNRSLHRGFVQGLLSIALSRLDYDTAGNGVGVLGAFALLADRYKNLDDLLRQDDQVLRALFDLLDQHAAILLRIEDYQVWRAISPCLTESPDTLYSLLRSRLSEIRGLDLQSADREFLVRKLALFPGETTGDQSHWHADALTEVRVLTDRLRYDLKRIHLLTLQEADSLALMDALEGRVQAAVEPSALLKYVHRAWKRAWLAEIEKERRRIRQMDVGCKQADIPPAILQVFRVMRAIGFLNGRYYRIHYLPGCREPGQESCLGRLELRYLDGVQTLTRGYDLGHSHKLDGELAKRVASYSRKKKPDAEGLIARTYPVGIGPETDPGMQHWDQVLGRGDRVPMFEIPVMRRDWATSPGSITPSYRAVAIFVFDPPEEWMKRPDDERDNLPDTPLSRESLRPALCRVIDEIKREEKEREALANDRLEGLDTEVEMLDSMDEMLTRLLKAAVEVSEADDGLFLMTSAASASISVRGATPESDELFRGVRFLGSEEYIPAMHVLTKEKPLCIPDFAVYPAADRVRAQLEQRFVDAKKRRRSHEWLNRLGSSLALPMKVEGQTIGVVSLRKDQAYAFDEYHLKAVRTLLLRYRWIAHSVRLNQVLTHWIYAFVHEIRSDLTLLMQGIDYVREDPSTAMEYADDMLYGARKVYDLSQNVLDTRSKSSQAPDVPLNSNRSRGGQQQLPTT